MKRDKAKTFAEEMKRFKKIEVSLLALLFILTQLQVVSFIHSVFTEGFIVVAIHGFLLQMNAMIALLCLVEHSRRWRRWDLATFLSVEDFERMTEEEANG